MAEELTRSLTMLSERGSPRGAAEVLEAARAEASGRPTPERPTWRRGLALAMGTAAAVVALIGGVLLVVRPLGGDDAPPATTRPPVVTTTPIPDGGSPHPYNAVEALEFTPDGQLWAATGGGVVRWNPESGEPTVFGETDGVPASEVMVVDAAPDGIVWVAGDGWIARYDGTWQVFSSANTPELDSQIGGMAVDPNGVVWVEAASEGPLRYDGTWTQIDAPPEGVWPHSFSVAPDGSLWAIGFGGGVLTYDGTGWRRYTESDGVPGATSNIAFATDGSIWIGSGRPDAPAEGIAKFDGSTWITFTVDDGLLSNAGAVVAERSGGVWVVHDEGLSRFDGSSWTTIDLGEEFAGSGHGAVVADNGTLWMPGAGEIIAFDGTDTTTLAVPPEIATQRQPSITLTPVPTQSPSRISTIIGDFEFTTMQLPTGHSFFFTEATPHGPVVTDGFDILRWSANGVTWDGILPAVDPWRITTDRGDVVVHGDGYARYLWDGASWTEASIVDLPGSTRHLALGPRGAVAMIDDIDDVAYHGTEVYYATGGVNFAKAEAGPYPELLTAGSRVCDHSGPSSYMDPPQSQIGPVLATEAGFVVLTPAHRDNWSRLPACEPLLWFSTDGNRWDLASSQSPFGEGAIVHRIAEHAGRFVAVGATPSESAQGAVWMSDDALTWQRADVEMDAAVGVAGGELGWMVTGRATGSTSDLAGVDMWFSTDGLAWDGPHQGPDALGTVYFLPELAVGTDAVYGVGGTHDTYIVGRLQQ